MSDCTCTNCIFIGDGKRYCYDCEQYTSVPTGEEFEHLIELEGRKQMNKVFATYKTHYKVGEPEGHIYLDKQGACTITLTGAASMKQHELDSYGKIMVEALNKQFRGEPVHKHYSSYPNHLPRLIKEIEERAERKENKENKENYE